jgi:alginate O-acetyltransferase complex protein AlgI
MVMFGWIMFDLDTMSGFLAYLRAMFTGKFFDSLSLYQLSTYGVMFVICIFASTDLFRRLCDRLAKNGNAEKFLYGAAPVMQILLLLLCTCYLVDASYNPFLYFRF